MPLQTKGFKITQRLAHFDKHRLEHSWKDQYEYEEMADVFLTKAQVAPLMECVRKRDGALIRFDPSTCEFGILHKSGYIGTYLISRHRGLEYFREDCKK